MPPTPKRNPARRNKSVTRSTLSRDHEVQAPDLPEKDAGWHPRTVDWWADVWSSPMAPEYDESDRHGLFLLAVLIDEFWLNPTQGLAAEIRLQRQCFGLTPIDRRRLQWEIERGEEAQEKAAKRRGAAARSASEGEDPRALLRSVQ